MASGRIYVTIFDDRLEIMAQRHAQHVETFNRLEVEAGFHSGQCLTISSNENNTSGNSDDKICPHHSLNYAVMIRDLRAHGVYPLKPDTAFASVDSALHHVKKQKLNNQYHPFTQNVDKACSGRKKTPNGLAMSLRYKWEVTMKGLCLYCFKPEDDSLTHCKLGHVIEC